MIKKQQTLFHVGGALDSSCANKVRNNFQIALKNWREAKFKGEFSENNAIINVSK